MKILKIILVAGAVVEIIGLALQVDKLQKENEDLNSQIKERDNKISELYRFKNED